MARDDISEAEDDELHKGFIELKEDVLLLRIFFFLFC